MPPRFNFCGACGAPVPEAAEHEVRKVVTVLFCDITDSTGLGEREDPERLRAVLGRYFDEIERIIAVHGGLVEKFIGDAVMAVFGLPSAHEDDALRAVRAAAEVHELPSTLAEETGLELAFRTGINTGEVVAGSGQTLVTGDAVNVAARLEQSARPGEILLGAETVRLLRRRVEVELLPPLEVQGKAGPVEACRFRGLAAAVDSRVSPFVGRERELTLLADAFRRTSEDRELHLFTVLGPAGMGKSRLVTEFVDSLTDEAEIARGRCLSYGQGITYWPLVEILRALGERAGIALERVLSGGATSPQELAWTVQQALEQAAEERPLVVVLDDLHWAEPALLDLLDQIAELSRGAAILMLCVARPELLEARPTWGGGKPNAASLLLQRLAKADSELLLSRVERPLEESQRQSVLEIGDGNPLFLEELSEFIAEGGGDGGLPPRIHALLQARLDLLPEPERQLLTCASVAGTVVHHDALTTLVPDELRLELAPHLAGLTRKWLLRPAGPELEGEEGYRFRHQLIRDTAYGALAKEDRARLHERFADWLEQRSGERAELDEIGAYHLEQAALCKRELGASEPALEERAGAALAVAGARAWWRTDMRAAESLWRRALTLLVDEHPLVPELEIGMAYALMLLSRFDEAQQLAEDAERRAVDASQLAAARLMCLHVRLRSAPDGVPEAMRRECAEALPLFEQDGDERRLALAWYSLAQAEISDLHVQAAAQAWANAAAHAERGGDHALEMIIRAESTERAGFERQPITAMVRELADLETQYPGEPLITMTLNVCRTSAAYYAGRRDDARTLLAEALADSRRLGSSWHAAAHTAAFGWGELMSGDVAEAERRALLGIRELRELHERTFLSQSLTLLAEIRIAQGRDREALELADEAEVCGPHDQTTRIRANCARARAHSQLGETADARRAAVEAVALADATDSFLAQADARCALAEVLATADELPAAHAAAEESGRLYTTLERTPSARRARMLAEEIERNLRAAEAPIT